MIVKNARELIGNTPHLFYKKVHTNDIYLKLEQYNFAGSVKDRIALSMVNGLLEKGLLKKGMHVIEATSGNTGIGLAFVLATYGIPFTITMPDSATLERIQLLEAYGAKVILTPQTEGMMGAKKKAQELANQFDYYFIDQFTNHKNPEAHMKTTAEEIMHDFPKLDYIVLGIGTSGTINGLHTILKPHYPNLKFIAVEPTESAVLSGKERGKHGIPGISPGFVPPFFKHEFAHEIVTISTADAQRRTSELAKEGLFFGVSTGATVLACERLSKTIKNKVILTIACDSGMKYLSMGIYGK
jgi:cysteine synthase A